MKKIISTKNAPDAIGPYSQGIEAGGFVFTSGQLGLVPETGEFAGNDVKSQAVQAFENLREILKASDCTLDDVVKTTCFLKNMDDFVIVNEVYTRFLSGKIRCRSCSSAKGRSRGNRGYSYEKIGS